MRYFISLFFSLSLFAQDSAYVFSALIDDDWKIVVSENEKFRIIETQREPRTFDFDFINKRVVYIASDKNLYLKNEGERKEELLLEADIDAYTQPMFTPLGEKIIMIKLIEGNSANTDVISLDPSTKKIKAVVTQKSTQLEPFVLNDVNLYYSNVTCVEGCGKIIQELWYKHLLSGDAYQLTLNNVISHQPSVDSKQENIYFSSNKKDYYHIWKMALSTGEQTQLTQGEVTDGYPMPMKEGSVLFIRRDGSKSMLMEVKKSGEIVELVLPKQFTKIRNLKVQR